MQFAQDVIATHKDIAVIGFLGPAKELGGMMNINLRKAWETVCASDHEVLFLDSWRSRMKLLYAMPDIEYVEV